MNSQLKNKSLRIIIVIGILLTCFNFLSCQKDNITPRINISEPILTDTGIVLNWSKVSDKYSFRYIVYRSNYYGDFDPLAYIDNIDQTTYVDHKYPFGRKIKYKIMAQANSNYSSNTVSITTADAITFNATPSKAFIMPELGKMIFFRFNYENTTLWVYDYKNNQILKTLNLATNTSTYTFGCGKNGDNYEFYYCDGQTKLLQIYDAITLNKLASPPYEAYYNNIFSVNNKYIFYQEDFYTKKINRETLFTSKYSATSNYMYLGYNSSRNELIGLNLFNKIMRMKLVDTCNVTNIGEVQLVYTTDMSYIEDSDFVLIPSYDNPTVFNLITGESNSTYIEKDYFPLNQGFFKNGVLYLYSLSSDEIYCYSTNPFKLIKVLYTRVASDIILTDDEFIYILDVTGDGSTLINKMKLITL